MDKMPNPNVTIRHARHAISLVLSGALRDIEAVSDHDEDAIRLFDEVIEEIVDRNTKAAWITRAENFICACQAELGKEPYPTRIASLLAAYDLVP